MTPQSPGKAWVQDKNKQWVKPPEPTDGFNYTWDDNAGWKIAIQGIGGSGSDSTWAAARADKFDVTGLGIPGHSSGTMTGDEIYQAINALATNRKLDPSGRIWSGIRSTLVATTHYTIDDLNHNWVTKDKIALQNVLISLHNNNKINPTATQTISDFLIGYKNNTNKNGLGATNNSIKTPVSVPATADLVKAASASASTVLNRTVTPDEAKMFAKQYQDMVLNYENAKKGAKGESSFAAPAQPIQFQPEGQPAQPGAIAPNGATPKTISTSSGALMQPPIPSTAAENFLANQNPVEASAAAAAAGLGQFLTMLKGA
jgi:hypothetical protein